MWDEIQSCLLVVLLLVLVVAGVALVGHSAGVW